MPALDLTPFGFTPTESRVYQVLLAQGPGTGYAIARAAGLARANAYSALEGLVSKGAARPDAGPPRRFRPEPPAAILARLALRQGEALEHLSRALEGFGTPVSPSMIEIASSKGALQLLTHEIGRATQSLRLLAPADAYGPLAPALRRAVAGGVDAMLCAPMPVTLPFARVDSIPAGWTWPGTPLIAVTDGTGAVIASREGPEVRGHWSSAPSFVAAALQVFERLRNPS
jgi:HTH-type transcriptional regulator, sugar sensing transcriptional regulator